MELFPAGTYAVQQAAQLDLPSNKEKVSYTFSTLPLSACSGPNLRVIISTESCRLFYSKKKKIFPEVFVEASL